MKILQQAFDDALMELAASANTEEELEALVDSSPNKLEELFSQLPNPILDSIKKTAYEAGLSERRQQHNEFVERNVKRWEHGFNVLELLIEVCIEAGSLLNDRLRPDVVATQDILFDVLTRLHAKGCLIAKEIVCLLKNGFADGAHARWRALHEITVTVIFLSRQGRDTAERYLSHEIVDSYKGACQHNKYRDRIQASSPSNEDLSDLKAKYDEVISQYGSDFSYPYGWAGFVLGKKKVNFSDLEEAVALDHWRPYYKWASQNIHASAKTIRCSLALVDSKGDILLVGPSSSGMVDPAHSAAISLAQNTVALLTHSPNLDSAVMMKIILSLSDEVGAVFLSCSKGD